MSEETVTFNLELNDALTMSNARKIELIFYRLLSLARRLGLPEDMDAAIMKIGRMTMAVRLLHGAITAIEASTPYGWALALVSVAGVSITTAEMTHEYYGDVQGH